MIPSSKSTFFAFGLFFICLFKAIGDFVLLTDSLRTLFVEISLFLFVAFVQASSNTSISSTFSALDFFSSESFDFLLAACDFEKNDLFIKFEINFFFFFLFKI